MDTARWYPVDERRRHEIIENVTAALIPIPEVVFAFLYGSFVNEPFVRDIDIGIFVKDMDPSSHWDFEISSYVSTGK